MRRVIKIMNLDGVPDCTGDRFEPGSIVVPLRPVPIQIEFDAKRTIGTALLIRRKNALYAEIYTDMLTVDDKLLFKMTPAVAGSTLARSKADPGKVLKYLVDTLGFSITANCDGRISTYGEQRKLK